MFYAFLITNFMKQFLHHLLQSKKVHKKQISSKIQYTSLRQLIFYKILRLRRETTSKNLVNQVLLTQRKAHTYTQY